MDNTWIAIEHPSKSQAFYLPIHAGNMLQKFGFKIQSQTEVRSGNQKIHHGHQVAILKVTYLKINRLLFIYTSNVQLKFGLDIQSQTEVRVQKPKNPIWPPGSHFERDISENLYASAHRHKQHAHEI